VERVVEDEHREGYGGDEREEGEEAAFAEPRDEPVAHPAGREADVHAAENEQERRQAEHRCHDRLLSAALTRRRRRQWGHLLQDLGIERFSLRERAEAGVDRGEEEPESAEPSCEEGRGLAAAALGERAL